MGVHAIDAMIYLVGEIDHVYCQSFARAVQNGTDDTTSMLFRMKDGMSGYLGTMTTTGAGFSFQVFGSKGWHRIEGVTHVAGASSEERRTRQFGACKFQPVKGPLETWEAERLDIVRATFEAFARAAEGGAPFPIPPEQIIHGASVSEAMIRSAGERQGRKDFVTERTNNNGSRQRPRPPDLFDARASRRHLGGHVDVAHHLRAAGAEARLPDRAVRRVAAAVERSASTLVKSKPERDKLKSFLADNNMYLYTVNAFPYGPFKNQIVKEQVYEPDWRSRRAHAIHHERRRNSRRRGAGRASRRRSRARRWASSRTSPARP